MCDFAISLAKLLQFFCQAQWCVHMTEQNGVAKHSTVAKKKSNPIPCLSLNQYEAFYTDL